MEQSIEHSLPGNEIGHYELIILLVKAIRLNRFSLSFKIHNAIIHCTTKPVTIRGRVFMGGKERYIYIINNLNLFRVPEQCHLNAHFITRNLRVGLGVGISLYPTILMTQ